MMSLGRCYMIACPRCGLDVDEHLANRCMDAWVAEAVMGWEKCCISTLPEKLDYTHWKTDTLDGMWYVQASLDWSPSTQIADAWLVVEKLAPLGQLLLDGTLSGDWHCEVVGDTQAEAETAPLAICRAALRVCLDRGTEGGEP